MLLHNFSHEHKDVSSVCSHTQPGCGLLNWKLCHFWK